MSGLNRVLLLGNLGQDPELRVSKNGQPWAILSLATNRHRKEGEEFIQETDWHHVKAFGQQAEKAGKYLSRGAQVLVEGHLMYEHWKDEKTGEPRRKACVLADKVTHVIGTPKQAGEAKPANEEGAQA